jgi:hypothetical protein
MREGIAIMYYVELTVIISIMADTAMKCYTG